MASSTDQDLVILGIAASLRRGSFNRSLVRAAGESAGEMSVGGHGMGVEAFHLDDNPLYNSQASVVGREVCQTK